MTSSPENPSKSFSFDAKKKTAGQVEVEIRGSKRHVKPYTIFSTELKALSSWNYVQNTAYNVAFSAFSFSIGLGVQAAFSHWNTLNPTAQAITIVGCPLSLIISIISWRVGKYLGTCTKALDEMIESETQHDK